MIIRLFTFFKSNFFKFFHIYYYFFISVFVHFSLAPLSIFLYLSVHLLHNYIYMFL
nr:MAG TPA: hypothetical protein [Caudoviricetes sp.]